MELCYPHTTLKLSACARGARDNGCIAFRDEGGMDINTKRPFPAIYPELAWLLAADDATELGSTQYRIHYFFSKPPQRFFFQTQKGYSSVALLACLSSSGSPTGNPGP